MLFRFLLLSEIRKDTCMLSADELKFIFLCMLPSKGDTKYIFFSRTSSSFSDPSEALQSLPTYFKGAFFYLAAWTPGIAWCLTITLHCPNWFCFLLLIFSSARGEGGGGALLACTERCKDQVWVRRSVGFFFASTPIFRHINKWHACSRTPAICSAQGKVRILPTHLFVCWPSLHLLTTYILKHISVHPRQAAIGVN